MYVCEIELLKYHRTYIVAYLHTYLPACLSANEICIRTQRIYIDMSNGVINHNIKHVCFYLYRCKKYVNTCNIHTLQYINTCIPVDIHTYCIHTYTYIYIRTNIRLTIYIYIYIEYINTYIHTYL